jgi:ribosome maturation factor RimP
MSVIDEISAVIAPVVAASGNYLEEVTIIPDGNSRILTVIVDSDTHLNLDQVTAVTREISDLLETLPVLGDQPFTLEVTSPGIDRPLTQLRHWKKNHGRLVSVVLSDGKEVKGRIGDIAGDLVAISEQQVSLADIKSAMIEIEFKSIKGEKK